MTDPKKPLSETLHLDLRITSNDTASVMMKDLLRRIAAGEVKVTGVIESADSHSLEQSLEITYIEAKGTKQ